MMYNYGIKQSRVAPKKAAILTVLTAYTLSISTGVSAMKTTSCFVYVISSLTATKIGISDNPTARLAQLQASHPAGLTMQLILECPSRIMALDIEKLLHERYADTRLTNEWFNVPHGQVVADIEWTLAFSRLARGVVIKREITIEKPAVKCRKPSPRLQKAIGYLEEHPEHLETASRELEVFIPGVSYGTINKAQVMLRQSRRAADVEREYQDSEEDTQP